MRQIQQAKPPVPPFVTACFALVGQAVPPVNRRSMLTFHADSSAWGYGHDRTSPKLFQTSRFETDPAGAVLSTTNPPIMLSNLLIQK
jgi:hypothetical protein